MGYAVYNLKLLLYDQEKVANFAECRNSVMQASKDKKSIIIILAYKPGLLCTTTGGEADWEKVALVVVRGTCGPAAPCGELGEGAAGAGPHSETPAWAGWCAGAGRGAVCAGCGSGSCAEGEEARRSGEMAEKECK